MIEKKTMMMMMMMMNIMGVCYLFSVVNVWIECWIDTIVLTIIMLL